MSNHDHQPTESERAFVAKLKAQDLEGLRELIDARAVSLDGLKHYKACMERVLAQLAPHRRWMTICDFKIPCDNQILNQQEKVIALLEGAIVDLTNAEHGEQEQQQQTPAQLWWRQWRRQWLHELTIPPKKLRP
jgi:hypothetical protein